MIIAREQVQHDYAIPQDKEKRKRVLKRKKRLSRSYRITMVSLVALVFFMGVMISFYYAQVFVATYRVNQLQTQLQSLQQESDAMQSRISQLTSLERIRTVAVNDLGMVEPENNEVMRIEVNKESINENKLAKKENSDGNQQDTEPAEKNWVIEAFTNLVQQVSQINEKASSS